MSIFFHRKNLIYLLLFIFPGLVCCFAPASVFAEGEGEEFSQISQQYYLLEEMTGGDADTISVDFSWDVHDIILVKGASRVWDPKALDWVEVSEEAVVVLDSGGAVLTITNKSSVAVTATAQFSITEGYEDLLQTCNFTNNPCEVGSVVDPDTHDVDPGRLHEQVITASLTLDESSLNVLTPSTAQRRVFGTYTITVETD